MNMTRPMIFLILLLFLPSIAMSGSPFDPVARVNGQVITQYELDQRVLFLSAMNIPGDLGEDALERLVNERLQSDAARKAGVTIGDSDVLTGMSEFAGRSNMDVDQFVKALESAGISQESFADFVGAGLAWRRLVRGLFGTHAQISDDEVERAVSLGSFGSGARILVSEIFLPADTPERLVAAQRLADEISQVGTASEFAAAARRFSVAPSATRGGQQDWVEIGNLPEAYRNQILALSPGQISSPIPLPNAIAIFQLHGVEESGGSEQQALSVDYASYLIPGGRSEAAMARAEEIKAEVDSCDDLYGIAEGQQESRLTRHVVATSELPSDVAAALKMLDEGEVSTGIVTDDGQMLMFLMLCGRTFAATEDVDREAVRQGLFNQRLAAYADSYLAELRAQAVIEFE